MLVGCKHENLNKSVVRLPAILCPSPGFGWARPRAVQPCLRLGTLLRNGASRYEADLPQSHGHATTTCVIRSTGSVTVNVA